MSAFNGTLPGGQGRNGLPLARPYRYQEADARREAEVARILARIRAEAGGEADGGPGYEWYREMEAERQELAAPVPAARAVITLPALPAAMLTIPALPAPRLAEPEPEAEPDGPQYCDACGYQLTAIGHKITCGEVS